jgi:hypothetical protein
MAPTYEPKLRTLDFDVDAFQCTRMATVPGYRMKRIQLNGKLK